MKPFDEAVTRLNPSQRLAVETIEGAVMLIAGPGTGKTEVLTLRIANILAKTQMNPDAVLALTFTDAAVHEMKKRLIGLIGNEAYRLSLYTFHGFCRKIIEMFDEEFEHIMPENNIQELEQIQIIEELLRTNTFKYLKPLSNPLMHAKSIVRSINELKQESVSAQMLEDAIAEDEIEFNNVEGKVHEKGAHKGKMKNEFKDWQKRIDKNRELALIYTLYESHLRTHKQYDFNDMILKVVLLLDANPDVLQQLQEKYQYILVDEHQDTNTSQNKLIEKISSYYENPNLFIVGDEKQAIFRFQGASIENFLYFKEKYPSAVLINLEENYRSSQTILDASHSLISHTSIPLPSLATHLQAKSNRKNISIEVAELENYFAEYAYVAYDVARRKAQGQNLSKITAICRINKDLFELARALEQKDIPFVIDNDQNILEDINIDKIFLLLHTISQYPSDVSLVHTMHLDFLELNPLDIYRMTLYAKKNQKAVWEVLESLVENEELELSEKEKCLKFAESMRRWKTYSKNNRLDDTIVRILNESGFVIYALRKYNSYDIFEKLTRLFQEVRLHVYDNPKYSLEDFLAYIELLRAHNLQLKSRHITSSHEAVQLITAHKAKGREFDHVYILNCFEGHWGKSNKAKQFAIPWSKLGISRTPEKDDTQIEDERRLFYVALTRARNSVTISYAKQNLEGKEQVQSQFISEIDPSFIKKAETAEFSSDFATHKESIFVLPVEKSVKELFFANKEYFLERLRRIGLSVTGLNNYISCPWKYFFRNLLQLPEEKNVSQLYGTAIHKALEEYILQRKNGIDSPDVLINAFTRALLEQPLLVAEMDLWKERGVKALTGYYENAIATWKGSVEAELNIPGVKYKDDLFLSGKLDMLDVISPKNEVRVYDFKTGKPKSRNVIEGKVGKGHGDYKRQLVFYKMLLDRYRNGFYKMVDGVIEFIEPNERDIYKSETFTITQDEIKVVEQEIDSFYSEMQILAFWDRFCDDPDCIYCQLRRFMTDEV